MPQEPLQAPIRPGVPQSELSADDAALTSMGIPHRAVGMGQDVTGKFIGGIKMPVGMASSPGALFGNTVIPTSSMAAPSPQTSQQAGVSDAAISAMMKEMTAPIDPAVITAGMTLVPSGHAMSMPQSMQQPLSPFQPRPLQPTGVGGGVVGKHAARMRGIENAVTGVTNAVGQVTRNLQQQQHEKVATGTQRLMEAQQAIDQAQQALKNPGITPQQAAQLQASIDRNKNVMNSILGDDKMRKDIAKGLDVSFTDPSKNRTPEHGAVAAGKQQAQETFQQQFQRQMPQTMQPDPVAQYKMQQQIAQKTADQKLLAAMIPRIMSAQSSMDRAHYVQGMMNLRLISNQDFQAQRLAQEFANRKELAGINNQYKLGQIYSNVQWSGQKMMELYQLERLDPVELTKFKTQMTQNFARDESSLAGAMNAVQKELNSVNIDLAKPGLKDAQKQALQQALRDTQFRAQSLQMMMKNLQDYKKTAYGTLSGLESLSVGNLPQTGGAQIGGPSTFTGTAGSGVGAEGTSGSTLDQRAIQYGLPFLSGGIALPPAESTESDTDESEDDSDTD
jgi:hypothetical protein